MYTLGIHIDHDASAALVKDGQLVAAIAEERFTRIKHYPHAPIRAIQFCLDQAKIKASDIDLVVIPSIIPRQGIEVFLNPKGQVTKFNQGEETEKDFSYYLRYFLIQAANKIELAPKITLPTYAPKFNFKNNLEVLRIEHHLGHAAAAYYGSGFTEKTLVITSDATGDLLSMVIWLGKNGKITPLKKIGREGSLGAFYSTVTEALGWWATDGEGKTMGLAPYGNIKKTRGVLDFIRPRFKNGELIEKYDWKNHGFWQDLGADHFHYEKSWDVLKLVKKYGKEDIAAEAQRVLEEELLGIVEYWIKKTETKHLAAGGGVMLNVKANQRIWDSGLLDEFYLYPDSGDSGGSVGAALYGYFIKNPKQKAKKINNAYFGPEYTDKELEKILKIRGLKYKKLSKKSKVTQAAKLLSQGKIIGWFQGREEVGPRALGNRSILMDPRRAENKDIINSRVKFREGFRPFCPSVIAEEAKNYFRNIKEAPFMIVSHDVLEEKKKVIPAVTHVDGTARPQTVTKSQNPLYYSLLKEFGTMTGVPVLLNTSFNIKGEPIVHTPSDAIRCFYDTGLDYLILGNFILEK